MKNFVINLPQGKEMHYIVEEADEKFIAHIFDDETSMQNWATKSRFNDVMNEWYSNRTLALEYAASINEFSYVEANGEYSAEYTEFLNTLQWTAKVKPKGTGLGILYENANASGFISTLTQMPVGNLGTKRNKASSAAGALAAFTFCDFDWWYGSKVFLVGTTPGLTFQFSWLYFDNKTNSFF